MVVVNPKDVQIFVLVLPGHDLFLRVYDKQMASGVKDIRYLKRRDIVLIQISLQFIRNIQNAFFMIILCTQAYSTVIMLYMAGF